MKKPKLSILFALAVIAQISVILAVMFGERVAMKRFSDFCAEKAAWYEGVASKARMDAATLEGDHAKVVGNWALRYQRKADSLRKMAAGDLREVGEILEEAWEGDASSQADLVRYVKANQR